MNTIAMRGILIALLIALADCGGGSGSSSGSGLPSEDSPVVSGPFNNSSTASTVALSAPTYSLNASAPSAIISVTRTGGPGDPAGVASVSYTTVNGTATAGTNYTATSGTLSWSGGDSSLKTITVPVVATTVSGTSFTVALSNVTGAATLGLIDSATVNIARYPSSGSSSGGAGSSSSSSGGSSSGGSSSSGASSSSSGSTTTPAGTLSFAAPSYIVAPRSGAVTLSVIRVDGSTGPASVTYATHNGTAVAGTDYTATSGTLIWSAGNAAPQAVPVSINALGAGGKNFSLSLASASGAGLGALINATVSIDAAQTTSLSIHVEGNHFVDGNGTTVQLRGASISALEGIFSNPATTDLWENAHLGPYPWWSYIVAWKIGVVRIPMNEASWLGYTCTNRDGSQVNPDAAGLYRSTIARAVADANAAGMYVALDLHWTAPQSICPISQDQLPDADNSIDFWTSVADTYKSNHAVLFTLFNEPYPTGIPNGSNPWQVLRDGASISSFSADSGNFVQNFTWQSAGVQAMVNAVRATGATNIVVVGGMNGASDLSQWLAYKPSDPLNQLAASWHAYGGPDGQTDYAIAILNAGIPVVIGEAGDVSANGSTSAPVLTAVTTWADQHGASVLAWAWDNWGPPPAPYFQLIKDSIGTPTDGEGVAFKRWLAAHPGPGNALDGGYVP